MFRLLPPVQFVVDGLLREPLQDQVFSDPHISTGRYLRWRRNGEPICKPPVKRGDRVLLINVSPSRDGIYLVQAGTEVWEHWQRTDEDDPREGGSVVQVLCGGVEEGGKFFFTETHNHVWKLSARWDELRWVEIDRAGVDGLIPPPPVVSGWDDDPLGD